jgi:hypothetical protein
MPLSMVEVDQSISKKLLIQEHSSIKMKVRDPNRIAFSPSIFSVSNESEVEMTEFRLDQRDRPLADF